MCQASRWSSVWPTSVTTTRSARRGAKAGWLVCEVWGTAEAKRQRRRPERPASQNSGLFLREARRTVGWGLCLPTPRLLAPVLEMALAARRQHQAHVDEMQMMLLARAAEDFFPRDSEQNDLSNLTLVQFQQVHLALHRSTLSAQ